MTSHLAQTLTGHGGFSQYLHRFKLKDSPYCACDPAKIRTCCTFSRNVNVSAGACGTGNGDWRHCREGEFPTIVEDDHKGQNFYKSSRKML
ncbi:hypothetical protein EVAR_91927_1 [Eumeta japonica]|uniref:Uncharacterized protein n=1 Tax=Eumeta variegata TaxID=151549 RepID=A0A4C1SUX1_EUMVA|nr:hypothetical protein EVAR_91927_1 [Eumeta japonica]